MRIFDILRSLVRPEATHSPNRPSYRWSRGWLFGSILTICGLRESRLLRIEGDVEKAVEIVEDVAEAVENVATLAEEIAKDVGEEFPTNGAVNKAAQFVEHLSEQAIQDAQNTRKFIDQMTSTEEIVERSIRAAVEAVKGVVGPSSTNNGDNVADGTTNANTQKQKSKSKL